MGIRDSSLHQHHPRQNGFAEGLIGSIRRTCLDPLVVLSEARLRRVLQSYIEYYNKIRTLRSLGKEARAFHPVQQIGSIASQAMPGRLHHHIIIMCGLSFWYTVV